GPQMGELKDFLNPKSMVTPGIAGSITMLIANTLWAQFELPQRWTALVASFLLGLIPFAVDLPIWQRLLYWIVNSLVIFSVGVGTNAVGHGVTTGTAVTGQTSLLFPMASIAFAQEKTTTKPAQEAASPQEVQRLKEQLERQRNEIQTKDEKI